MSRPQDPQRPYLPFKNPFSMILPKGSHLSPRLLALLNAFEESLAEKLRSLMHRGRGNALSVSWMKEAMASLSTIHTDIKILVTELELPVCDWDDKWIDVYMDNSVSLLDICTAFSSEILRLNQANLYLRCTVRNLDGEPKQFVRARSSLDGWRQRVNSKNPRLENSFAILDRLTESLKFPKKKDSAKGKVLMQALYGVQVITIFLCSLVASGFSGSIKKLKQFEVLEGCSWAEAFANLQSLINNEISGGVTAPKELEAVDAIVKTLYPMIESGGSNPAEAGGLQNATSELAKNTDKLAEGLDVLAKEVDGFFQIVLTGRDAMLSNIRVGSKISQQDKKKCRGANSETNNRGHVSSFVHKGAA
ncbi:PREDICTED: protein BPS1, chloroplastic-like [Ipomoea nil]|uniref:protein BPS1, chloroplastic-like n=1 Tax=Ipomoea nil TaxID=35883 RepID=UPI000901E3C2|nr:PREDICTED: protein BPS1, chloroplastic-like [Ipomoea nil]XP_019159077.1 PREDICTED: protein BPS1, chloroplastic-like [Ipomoea nil]